MHHGRSHRRRLRSSYDGNLLRGWRRARGRAAQAGVLRERHGPGVAVGRRADVGKRNKAVWWRKRDSAIVHTNNGMS